MRFVSAFAILVASAQAAKKSSESTTVLILGAGASGISAAKTLYESGVHDFILLEGDNEIGGRVKQGIMPRSGQTVEVGASWIQGTAARKKSVGANPIWEIAREINLVGKNSNFDDVYSYSYESGSTKVKDKHIRWDDFEQGFDCFQKKGYAFGKEALANGNGGVDRSAQATLAACGWIPESAMDYAVQWWDMDYEYADVPAATGTVSGFDTSGHTWKDKDYYVTDTRGFNSVLKHVAKEFLGESLSDPENRLRLNTIVTKIEYSDKGVKVTVKELDGSTKVYKADYAITTFSAGVLNKSIVGDGVKFSPALPAWKKDAISRSQLAHYIGVYLEFENDFWDDSEFMLWGDQLPGKFPLFQNLKYYPNFKGKHILRVDVTGSHALHLGKSTNAEIAEEIMVILRQMFKNAEDPIDVYAKRWMNDKFTYGSYSNYPSGTLPWDIDVLGYPVKRLYFAGEAASVEYFGFVHGAYLNGKDCANNVLDCMNGNCLPTYEKEAHIQSYIAKNTARRLLRGQSDVMTVHSKHFKNRD